MPTIRHPATGFPVGDPDLIPLAAEGLPSPADIAGAASSLILSSAGWRKVFAADGDEESPDPGLSAADLVLAGAAAMAFAGAAAMAFAAKVRERSVSDPARTAGRPARPAVLVGIDSRPTGPAIADAIIRVLLGLGFEVRYLFIVAAPEIMAYARPLSGDGAAGFCYVSASHNPRGHNGLKFGIGGGGVLGGAESAALIASYRALLAREDLAARVLGHMEAADRDELARAYSGCSAWKRRSVSAYTLFAREVVCGSADPAEQDALLDEMAASAAARPVGVVAEQNGSARCLSIDRDFLEGLGVRVRSVNDRPRDFAHRIVPEGESLGDAIRELEAARAEDGAFTAGYVPDCDGDRGNLVIAGRGAVRALEAQEVFALSCVAELALLVRAGRLRYDASGRPLDKVAVAVNDATSMRLEAIAAAFGAEPFRAETGEANVVGLAESLRARGYEVRILGEGSNGGNITFPSQVRDPLATLGALLKLLLLRGEDGLFAIWLRRLGRAEEAAAAAAPGAAYGVDELLASLPRFATTSVFEPRAALRVKSADQAALKGRYAGIFALEWEEKRPELERRFGIRSWKAFATNGQAEAELGADFAASGRGGLRIVLYDAGMKAKAFLWMRGSGTESVFRVMADIEGGSAEDEEFLLGWHASMVRRAELE